ncbi:hypothetical protein GA0115247_10773 [Streptomyces sp. PalvLS-984]|nr:hypothetical protein GA0115247_10773 [Streptomyces sp. PalvLS-984]
MGTRISGKVSTASFPALPRARLADRSVPGGAGPPGDERRRPCPVECVRLCPCPAGGVRPCPCRAGVCARVRRLVRVRCGRKQGAALPLLEDQPGLHPRDLPARGELVQYQSLQIRRPGDRHVYQVVVRTGEMEQRARLRQGPDPFDERADELPAVRPDLHQQKGLQAPAQQGRVEPQPVPEDHSRTAQPGHPVQTGGRRHPDLGGQLPVRRPGIVLQKPQNTQIHRIQSDGFRHTANVTRVIPTPGRSMFRLMSWTPTPPR